MLRMGMQGPIYQDNSNNMQQMHGKIIIQTNFIHISVLNYIFLFSEFLCTSFYIVASEMKNLNKSNFLSLTKSNKETLKKKMLTI